MSQTAAQKAAKAQKEVEKDAKQAGNEQTQPNPTENEPETQKIKFLRSHPRYGYWPGSTADLTAEHVTLLVEGKFAELVTDAAPDSETEE